MKQTDAQAPANTRNLARKLKALSNPDRLNALCALLDNGEEDLYLEEFARRIGQDQTVVSRYMTELSQAGFVDYHTYVGRKHYYYVNMEKINECLAEVQQLLEQHRPTRQC